jgi:diguanylate cyclase (GGDEF)-like protein
VHDANGQIRYYLKIAEDITRQRQIEQALLESYKALQASESQLRETCRELKKTARALRQSKRLLKKLSREDALTGLLNRRGLQDELVRLQALAERKGESFGILIIDIDHFKQINDLHGHTAGDRILKTCASLLRNCLRASDIVCRYGGDEIVIALPSADAETTKRTAERIQDTLREHDFTHAFSRRTGGAGRTPGTRAAPPPDALASVRKRRADSDETRRITVSIGAACKQPEQECRIDEIIRQADQALYRVKRSGRNGISLGTSVNATK